MAILVAAAVGAVAIVQGRANIQEEADARVGASIEEAVGVLGAQFSAARRSMESVAPLMAQEAGSTENRFARSIQVADVFATGIDAVWLQGEQSFVRPPSAGSIPAQGTGWFVEGEHAYFGAATTEGLLVARMATQTLHGILLEAVTKGVSLQILGAATTLAKTGQAEGEPVSAPIPGTPLVLEATHSDAAVRALQQDLTVGIALASGLLAIFAAAIGMVIGESIVRPVVRVEQAARKLQSGRLDTRAPLAGPKETRALAQGFNAMAETLEAEHEELLALQHDLEERVQVRTEELEAAKGQMELFFYGVSHDIKSPIVSIVTLLQLSLRRGEMDDLTQERLEKAVRASQDLRNLVVELLEFARAGADDPEIESCKLADVLPTIADVVGEAAAEKGVTITWKGPPTPVRTDVGRLRRIVQNLLDNAIKYMPDDRDGHVSVTWRKHRGGFRIKVADNGAGIPTNIRQDLYRPFAKHAKGGAGSVGLGLSIVRRMTESLRGNIHVASSAAGTTFTLDFPQDTP